jgi:hypothetical protein
VNASGDHEPGILEVGRKMDRTVHNTGRGRCLDLRGTGHRGIGGQLCAELQLNGRSETLAVENCRRSAGDGPFGGERTGRRGDSGCSK